MDIERTDGVRKLQSEPDALTFKSAIGAIKYGINYLLAKWLVIGCFVIVGGLLGYLYDGLVKPAYTATSTFVLEESDVQGGLAQYAGIASMVGIDIGGGGGLFQGDNIIELYKSRMMIQETLLKPVNINGKPQKLIDRYIQFNELRDKWKDDPVLRSLTFDVKGDAKLSRVQDSVLSKIVKQINKKHLFISKPDKKLSILRVDVISKDEVFAKVFNDQIVANVNEFYVRTKTKKALQMVKILEHKTDSVRSVMYGSIYSAAAITDATPNLNPTRQIQRAAPVQRSQFSAETNKAILSELVKNLELSRINLSKETPLIQLVDYPLFPLDNNKIGRLKGLVLGAILAGGFIVIVLLIKRLYMKLME